MSSDSETELLNKAVALLADKEESKKIVEKKATDDTNNSGESDHDSTERAGIPPINTTKQDEDSDSASREQWTFLEKIPEIMMCKICCNIFESPRLLTCCSTGICKRCIERHLQTSARLANQKPTCPFCRKEEIKHSKNTSMEESINELKVQCCYESKGCAWTGTLQNGKLHLRVCEFCPVVCPNKCSERFERYKLSAHLRECPFQHVECLFEAVGCEPSSVLLREGARDHTHSNIHHHLLLIARFNAQMLDKHRALAKSVQSQMEKSYQGNILSQNELLRSSTKESIKSLTSSLQEVQKKTAFLRRELANSEICLTQVKAKLKRLKEIEGDFKGTIAQIEPVPIPTTCDIYYCPPVTMTISNFRRRKMLNDRWISPPFYTHEGGYKLCLSIYANGVHPCKNSFVSVYIHMMMGEFDDQLEWPFAGALFTVTAISQYPNSTFNKSVNLSLCGADTIYARQRQVNGTIIHGVGNCKFIGHFILDKYLTSDNSLIIKILRVQFPL